MNVATDKQITFITKLLGEKDTTGSMYAGHTVAPVGLTRAAASSAITALLALPKKAKPAAFSSPLEVGMYKGDKGEIVRVYLGRNSGTNLAALLVEGDTESGWDYEYLGSSHRLVKGETNLGPVMLFKMPLEEAVKWGKMTSSCIVCARRLDDPKSVDAGIGPVCKSKYL